MPGIDDRFVDGDYFSPVCSNCNNLLDMVKHTCRAFPEPDRIPDEIWGNSNKHTKPVKGDMGIIFQPIKKTTPNQKAVENVQ